MKKITLLSDSHDFIDDQILKYCKESDEIWHAGDIGDYRVIEKIQSTRAKVRAVWKYRWKKN